MPKETKALSIKDMQTEIDKNFADPTTLNALLTITFNGMKAEVAKRAALEATMRGYTFKDFLEKNVYAIPYGDKYSLVSSIDHARKIGMRSGVCGKNAPIYTDKDNRPESCTITIKKQLPNGYIGEFTSTAYFLEYNTGKNLWISKPRTMLAKVAEMQALRMACPEELSQAYIEEENQEAKPVKEATPAKIEKEESKAKLDYLKELLKNAGKTETSLLGYIKKTKMTDLSKEEIDEWIDKLEKGIITPVAKKEVVVEAEAEVVNDEEPVYQDEPEIVEEETMLENVMKNFPNAEVVSQTPREKLAGSVEKLRNYKK